MTLFAFILYCLLFILAAILVITGIVLITVLIVLLIVRAVKKHRIEKDAKSKSKKADPDKGAVEIAAEFASAEDTVTDNVASDAPTAGGEMQGDNSDSTAETQSREI